MIITPLVFAAWFGFWNCARGRKLFGLTDSTAIGRIISTCMMAALPAMMLLPDVDSMTLMWGWIWLMLMVWCTPAWDNYWSVTIGDRLPPVTCFAPVDWLMSEFPWDRFKGRIWGLVALTLRMMLILPAFVGEMIYLGHYNRWEWLLCSLLMGIPYYISGYVSPRKYVIAAAEIGTGAIIGIMAFGITN